MQMDTLVSSVRPPVPQVATGFRMGERVVADNLIHFLRRWLGVARDLHHGRHRPLAGAQLGYVEALTIPAYHLADRPHSAFCDFCPDLHLRLYASNFPYSISEILW